MAEEKTSLSKHLLWQALGAMATIAGTAIAAWLSPKFRDFLWAIPSRAMRFFRWMGTPVEVSRWWYWFLIGVAIGMLVVLLLALVEFFRGSLPNYYAYTEESVFGIIWRWRWSPHHKLGPEDLRPHCPMCDRLLVCHDDHEYGGRVCHVQCDQHGGIAKLDMTLEAARHVVWREIDLKIRKETYPAAKNTAPS